MTHNTHRYLIVLIFLFILPALSFSCTPPPETDAEHFTIGLITNNQNGLRNIQGFRDGMVEFGYIEGQNVTYLFDGNPTSLEQLESALQGMVEADVDLIFTAGTPTGIAAYQVTADTGVPVVFGVIADPIKAGVVTDLTRPGGTMTGVMLSANQGLRLEIFLELKPEMKRVYVPYDPLDAASHSAVSQIVALASDLGLEIVEGHAHEDEEVTALLNDIPLDIDAIFLVPGTAVNARLENLLAIATERKIPISGPSTAQVEEGALMTYGFIHQKTGSQAARIADQILKGTEPGEIPVEIAEFFLAINLPAADSIGLEVPNNLLQRADVIIRDGE